MATTTRGTLESATDQELRELYAELVRQDGDLREAQRAAGDPEFRLDERAAVNRRLDAVAGECDRRALDF
jgi:hypothetical protein